MWLLCSLAYASSRLAHSEAHTYTAPVVSAPEIRDAAAIDEPMRAWLRTHVPPYGTDDEKMRRLLAAIEREKPLTYDPSYTRTAAEVFESGRFNCLSLAHLLVGLGRELGVDAYYARVEVRAWHEQDGLSITSTHVAAAWGPKTAMQLVDIEPVTERERRMARRIEDSEALALHYSNRGAESLVAQRPDIAVAWLDAAVALSEGAPEPWINRGVAQRQAGDLDAAIASYERALEIDPASVSAWRNLVSARAARGEEDAVRGLLASLVRESEPNPYTWLALGDTAMQLGEISSASRLYRRARQRSWGNPDVLYALARLAAARGEHERASVLKERAERLQGDQ